MKKKTEPKNKALKEPIEQVAQEAPQTQMNDEEFDRYIDNIMEEKSEAVEEEATVIETESESAPFDAVREDIHKLINVMNGFISSIAPQVVAQEPKQPDLLSEEAELDIAKKAQLYDMLMQQKKRHDAIRKNLFRQEDDLKKVYSDFDLKRFYNTEPLFKAELDKTGSVYAAYLKMLASKPGAAEVIKRNFLENGAMPNLSAGSITTSPAGLPDKEFDEYIRNILGQV